jgi:hypothetical protein
MSNDEKVPIVFISYCWTSELHKQWVLALAIKLEEESGVEVILDQWHAVIGHDRFHFMEDSIRRSDKVLVICDKNYCLKANNREGGVGTETSIITPDIYGSIKQEKFIPIVLDKKSNGDFLLPDYFSSRFALGMLNVDEFESKYKELERLIWREPLLKPPVRGLKPNFTSNEIKVPNVQRPVFNENNKETVLWLLPRGFLYYTDITYQSYDSWAVVVSYYDYEGDWKHGTHYHESYSRTWERNIETQYTKLSIPKADWNWCRAPLNFLQELREVSEPVNIEERVQNERMYDYPVLYFKPSEPILLPEVPQEYRFYHDTGNLRDLLEKIRDKERNTRLQEEELLQRAMSIRQSVYLESLAYLGESHPSLVFIKEVLDDFNKSFSSLDIFVWFSSLERILQNSLNHEWDKWDKELKRKTKK